MNKKIIPQKSPNFPLNKNTRAKGNITPHKKKADLFSPEGELAAFLAKMPEIVVWVKQGLAAKSSTVLEADISAEIKRKIQDGTIDWVYDKQGKMLAQLKDGNGKIFKNIRLKKSTVREFPAIEQMVIQAKLEQISQKLDEIARSLDCVYKGQHIDRISKCYAAMEIAEKAKHLAFPEQKARYASALFLAAEGFSQIKGNLAQEVAYFTQIKPEQWWLPFGGIRQKEINKRMETLRMYLNDLHKGIIIYARIYMEMGEISSMREIVSEYFDFLKETFSPQVRLKLNSQVGQNSPYLNLWDTDLQKMEESFIEILKNIPERGALKWDNVKNAE